MAMHEGDANSILTVADEADGCKSTYFILVLSSCLMVGAAAGWSCALQPVVRYSWPVRPNRYCAQEQLLGCRLL
jgi:hypothetical protein